jgi:peptidoglycan/LPS O-acetylase OafA/YrhL
LADTAVIEHKSGEFFVTQAPASDTGLDFKPTSGKRSDIQGMRAVAVLAVVAFHAGLPIPGGFVGVDVFFVISGFVITLMLRREWLTSGRIRLRHFYKRRFLRLAPAMSLMICFTLIISAFALSPFGFQTRVAQTAIGAEFSVANFVIAFTTGGYFDLIAAVNPLLHTWSLSVEEQFYLVFPAVILIAWILARKYSRLAHLPITVLGIGVLISFGLTMLSTTGWTPRYGASLLGFYSPATRAWEFGVGAMLALSLAVVLKLGTRMRTTLGIVGALALLASFWLITENTPFPGPWTLLPVCATLAVIISGTGCETPVARMLSTRPMIKIGDWSYSIYLWHWPLIVFAGVIWPKFPQIALCAAIVSFAPAIASYVWLETPIRRLRGVSRPRLLLIISVTVIPPIALAIGLQFGSQHGWGNSRIQAALATSSNPGSGLPSDCMSSLTIKGLTPAYLESCVFNAEAKGAPVYLVGDSNAAMHFTGILQATESLGRPLYVSTAADCLYSDIFRKSQWGDVADRACRSYFEDTTRWLTSAPKGTVVIGGSIRYGFDSTYEIGTDVDRLEATPQARQTALNSGLLAAVTALQSAGQVVVLTSPTFRFDSWADPVTAETCSTWSLARGTCPVTRNLAEVDDWQLLARNGVLEVADKTGSGLLDLVPYQCADGVCGDAFDGVRVYDDPSHISAALSAKTVPDLERLLVGANAQSAG